MSIQKLITLLALAATPFAFAEGGAKGGKPEKPGKSEGDRPGKGERGPDIAPEIREKIKAAHEAALKDPAVIKTKEAAEAAHKKARESKSEEDRKAAMEAHKAHHEAVRAAMIKIDPSIADILAKHPMIPGRPHGKGPRGGEGDDAKGPHEGKGKGKGKGKGPQPGAGE